MGSNSINAARQAALAKVQSGEWSASQAYAADRSGAFTRGMFEPVEAQAKAAGAGQWRSASQADRQQAASFTPSQRQPSQATQRARAAGINPFGYNGATDASGRAVDSRPAGGMLLPSSMSQTPRRSLQVMPGGSPYEDPANKAKQQELDALRGYAEEFKGTDAAPRYQIKIDQLSRELEEAYKPRQSVAPKGYSASDTSWGQDYGPTPGEAAISREQTAAAQPMNGAANNNVGKLTPPPLPTRSNYAGVQNRFDETYTGRLLAQTKDRAAQQYAQRQAEITSNMAQRGLTQAGTPGLEAQLQNEARVGYDSSFNQLANQAQTQAAELASNFDMQRAGALDAFDMNRGNLALGYSADARAGMLLPAQVRAANAGAGSAESQALIDNQNAYEYGLQERANNRGARDNLSTLLAGSQYEGASIANALRGLDFQTQQSLVDVTIQMGRNQGQLSDAQAREAKFIADNQGVLAFANFIAGIAPGVLSFFGKK